MKQERHSQAVSSSCGLVLLDSLHFNKWKRVCSCKYRTVQQVCLTLSFGVTKVSYYSWVVLSLVKKTNMVPTSTRRPSLEWYLGSDSHAYSAVTVHPLTILGKGKPVKWFIETCANKSKSSYTIIKHLYLDDHSSLKLQPGQADSVVVVYFGFCYPVFTALSVFGVRAHFENRSAVSSSLTLLNHTCY